MIKVRLFLVLSLFLAVGRVAAQAPAPAGRTITLEEVIQRARENPPAVLAALATLERTRHEEHAAGGAYYPSLTIEGRGGIDFQDRPYVPGQPRYRSSSLTTNATATVDYTLLDAQRSANVKAAHAQVGVQEAQSQDVQRSAVEGAVALYHQALAARELIADAQLSLERRTTQFESIKALAQAGVRPSVDAQRAEIEVVIARTNLRLREVDEESLAAALAGAVGEDPRTPLRPAGPAEASANVATPAEAIALALEHRPDVRAGRATVEARMAQDEATRAARLPTLGVSGSGQLGYVNVISGVGLNGQAYSASGGLYLRWAALDATVWRRSKVSGAGVLEAERALDATQQRVQNEAVAASYATQLQKVRLEQAEQVLAGAEVTRKAQNDRYKAGVATLLELLDAERVEQTARVSRIEAQRDFEVARARLSSVCGVLGAR